MRERDRALGLILEVVDEINESLPAEERILVAEQTPLFCADTGFDSLCLLHLIQGVEMRLAATSGTAPNLFDVLTGVEAPGRPRTLGALATLLAGLEGKLGGGDSA